MPKSVDILYTFIRDFTERLYSVREILDTIIVGFDDFTLLEGEIILVDVFAALSQIDDANHQLAILFHDSPAVLSAIDSFSLVVEEAEFLGTKWNGSEGKQELIKRYYQVFAIWQTDIQNQLIAYTIS